MLFWLLQSLSAHPNLAQGEAPKGLLAPEELEEFRHFTSQARRCDWLLGRWTAKRLLQQVVQQHCGYDVPLDHIVIQTAHGGAPVTGFREPFTARPFSLSISHSQGYALCAVVEGQDVAVGVDLEAIEPRTEDFVEAFFTPEERALLSNERLHDMQVTAIWSAKEAALKAVRLGMRAGPQHVSCLVQPVAVRPQDWTPYRIVWQLQDRPSPSLPKLAGWWQALGAFVLTLATPVVH